MLTFKRSLTSLATALLATLAAQSHAQDAGFAIGRDVQWQAPQPSGASPWRAGLYSGVIEEISGGGQTGSAAETHLVDLHSGKIVRVRMNQITSIRCVPGESFKIASTGQTVTVCHFGGAVNGTFGLETRGWLRVRLFDEVELSDGSTAKTYAGYYPGLGTLRLGRGTNEWATRNKTRSTTTQTTTPTSPTTTGTNTGSQTKTVTPPVQPPISTERGVHVVPEIGQAYAHALKVGYPATIQANMTQGDYDTYLFDFAGGTFQAHSSSTLNLVADLLDTEGKMITRAMAANGTFQFNQTLPAGRYGIIVRVMHHAGAGAYEMILGSGTGSRYREQ